jgi:tRNA(fMet)-specific endonuclease VapC
MSKYLLDTNILVAYMKKDDAVRAKIKTHLHEISLSVITLGELSFGAYKSDHWQHNLRLWSNVIPLFEVIPIHASLAQTYGLVKSSLQETGITIGDNDLWIAATALDYGLTLVTRDRDFDRIKGFQLNIEAW